MMTVHGKDVEGRKRIRDHEIRICTQNITGSRDMHLYSEHHGWDYWKQLLGVLWFNPIDWITEQDIFHFQVRVLADLGNLMVLLCDTRFSEKLLFLLLCTALSLLTCWASAGFRVSEQPANTGKWSSAVELEHRRWQSVPVVVVEGRGAATQCFHSAYFRQHLNWQRRVGVGQGRNKKKKIIIKDSISLRG